MMSGKLKEGIEKILEKIAANKLLEYTLFTERGGYHN